MNKFKQELDDYLKSDKGKAHLKAFVERMNIKNEVDNRWVEKIKTHYGDNIDLLTEKLMNKYYSDEYVNREYKRGCEPREPLLWILLLYAEKYGEKCRDEKYWNVFTATAYYLGSYVIQLMNGQGSVVKIDKIES